MANKICLLHDTFLYKGGGERLVLMMANAIGSDLASGFFDKGSFDPKKEGFKGKMISLLDSNRFFDKTRSLDIHGKTDAGIAKRALAIMLKGMRHVFLKWAFSTKTGFLKNYDTVVMSGNCLEAAGSCRKNTKKIYYCHTTPRFLFDQKEAYLQKVPFLLRPIYRVALWYFKRDYLKNIAKIDTIYVNSKNIQGRLKQFTGRNAEVIYPCVADVFVPTEQVKKHYLSWGRLSSIKRVDRIVEAFKEMPDKQLVFTYGVNDPEREIVLKLAAGYPNITPLLSPSNDELVALIGQSFATIYIPVDEDFGMSPIESMACGIPVIGVNDGGLKETIIPGQTGLLIGAAADVEELKAAVRKMDEGFCTPMKDACIAQADKFTQANFENQVRAAFGDAR